MGDLKDAGVTELETVIRRVGQSPAEMMLMFLSGMAEVISPSRADPHENEAVLRRFVDLLLQAAADKKAERAAEVKWWRLVARDRQLAPERRELARRRLREMGEPVSHDRGGLGTNPLPSGALLELHRRWRTLLVWLRRKTAEEGKFRARELRMEDDGQYRAAERARGKAKAAEVTVAALVKEARAVLGPWFPLYDVGYFQSPPAGSPIKVKVDGKRERVTCFSVETARVLGHLAGKGDRAGWARDQITAARKVVEARANLSYSTI